MKGGMPVDCPLIFSRKHHSIQIKLNKESEENSLKKFKVTLTGHYQKTISVYAETPEQVKEKTDNSSKRKGSFFKKEMGITSLISIIMPPRFLFQDI